MESVSMQMNAQMMVQMEQMKQMMAQMAQRIEHLENLLINQQHDNISQDWKRYPILPNYRKVEEEKRNLYQALTRSMK